MERDVRASVAGLVVGLWATAVGAGVSINEIMYHPASDENNEEFVELYNSGPLSVDLSGWCFEGIDLCFGAGDSIAAGAYLVLAPPGGATASTYSASVYREWGTSSLADSGERIACRKRCSVPSR